MSSFKCTYAECFNSVLVFYEFVVHNAYCILSCDALQSNVICHAVPKNWLYRTDHADYMSRVWCSCNLYQTDLIATLSRLQNWLAWLAWYRNCSLVVFTKFFSKRLVAPWCSGSALVSINVVALHQAWLILRWVPVCGFKSCLHILVFNQPLWQSNSRAIALG